MSISEYCVVTDNDEQEMAKIRAVLQLKKSCEPSWLVFTCVHMTFLSELRVIFKCNEYNLKLHLHVVFFLQFVILCVIYCPEVPFLKIEQPFILRCQD